MFRIIREINATIRVANEISRQAGYGPRWTLFLTNRSFIFQAMATPFALLGLAGIVLPIEASEMTEIVGVIGFLLAQGAVLIERALGKSRVVWNRCQAVEAVEEADALSRALENAGAGD